eukprot:SAG11_NODE_16548_length_544_cov_1.253933_2_plen_45_part_01
MLLSLDPQIPKRIAKVFEGKKYRGFFCPERRAEILLRFRKTNFKM